MYRLIFVCWMLSYAFMAHAQTLTVKEKESGIPLELVLVSNSSPENFAYTDVKGQVDISKFESSEKIEFRLLGYKKQVKTYHELKDLGFVLFLEPSSLNLSETVVSATRWVQSSENIPSRISAVSAENIAFQNPQTAADLLGISGKVYIQKSQQGGGSPMIRGFATNRLLYSVDGVRMNTAIFRGGNIQNVINLDPFAIEKTEVFFGPGSVIYGSDAIGGVMSFQTLSPKFSGSDKLQVNGNAITRYSSANKEKTGHFDVNLGWDKWALATSVSHWDYDDLRQGSNGPVDYLKPFHMIRQNGEDVVIQQKDPLLQVPSAYSQLNLMQKVRFKPNDNWDFQYGFHYSETSKYGRYDRHNRLRDGLPRYAEWDYGPQKWMMNNLSITHQGNAKVYDRMNIRLAQQYFEESRIDRSLNKKIRSIQVEKVEAYSLNWDFTKALDGKHTLFYGAEYVVDDVNSKGYVTDITTNIEENGASRYPISTWKSFGVYVNDEYRISEKVTMQGGLRYNVFVLDADFSNNLPYYPFPFTEAYTSDGALSGSIGAVWKPSKSWIISTNFGTAFRSPNVDDIGKIFDSEPGSVTVPNPDLKAENAYNIDFGLAKLLGETVKLDLTAYYTNLQNALVRRNYQLNGLDSILYEGELSQVQAIQNAAVARVYGVQAGIEVDLPGGFGITSDLNFQKGEEELDDGSISPSRHAAPLFGVSRLTYSRKKLRLELNAFYQAEKSFNELPVEERSKSEIYAKDANGNNYSPSWYTLNFKGMYSLNQYISFNLGLENITDQRYRSYSSGISGPGRNWVLSLTGKF
ncbi:TonB-dependent receptor [Algoriphagus sp. CAU 1675]|uniref:TonB-dependent receptor n=1 Tax=Algoriphagus sp. CAU 1675 TaxID=3032597 RepID=UPI0023D98AAD|nr:TonB-dependent receptor [Algoriphagus sp. CAU 1675]MDF2158139.1 TonB-dependent receptor [Algoriphagus sp. CAU 1675]